MAKTTKKKHAPRTPRTPRRTSSKRSTGVKITAERVRLNRGGYDSHGRYFGTGQRLYSVSVTDRGTDIAVDTHVRADTARDAKASVLASMMKSLSLNEEQRAAVAHKHGGSPYDSHARSKPAGHRISTAGPQPDFERYSHEAINLEGLTDDELRSVARAGHPALRDLANTFLEARRARLAGRIEDALHFESVAQSQYDRLPTHLRW